MTKQFRRGQWVTLAEAVTVIAAVIDGEAVTKTLPAGTVGIHHQPDQETPTAGGRPNMDRAYQVTPDTLAAAGKTAADLSDKGTIRASVIQAKERGLVGFHQVDATGFDTVRDVLVRPDQLNAVTSREQVPAKRLATMDPAWQPVP